MGLVPGGLAQVHRRPGGPHCPVASRKTWPVALGAWTEGGRIFCDSTGCGYSLQGPTPTQELRVGQAQS